MDRIDKAIVSQLRANARTPFLKLAKQLGISEGTVRNRVERMLESGEIKRFTVESGPGASSLSCMIAVKFGGGRNAPKAATLHKIPCVVGVYEITGAFDALCLVEVQSTAELNSVIDEVRGTQGVQDTQTFMIVNKF